ncbi:hypothetical protein JTE90_012525 [Oedothorax gibbosus]|uniref:Uncharacterized protein n=1 Tax=Oedothorax gibbosus TaxID=931172 RepID=A0AAV6V0Z5_9ARAC|nr:hypothetical protein JTE90_012525 [Oedothorax gibbosus]
MHNNPASLDTCGISPVRPSTKHQITPHRKSRKTLRRDQCSDVHTSCSTPTHSPGLASRISDSPSSSFPYSQENCPDVVWDYTSPKLPSRGSRKKEIKLTVKELLENLNQCQVPETNTQSQQYIKLLENYMAKQDAPSNVQKPGKPTRNRRQPQAHALEELKKFLETIPRQKKELESTSRTTESANTSKLNMSTKSFLDGESSECDSTEELWGDNDNSFIVKATQELEEAQSNNPSLEAVSTIPETNVIPNKSRTINPSPESVSTILETIQIPNKSRVPSTENKVTVDVETYNDLLEQLTNVDWDSVDYDEWDNGFIEDDALSSIPDDVLNGCDEGTQPVIKDTNEDTVIYSVGALSKTNTAIQSTGTVLYNSSETSSLSKIKSAIQNTDTLLYNAGETGSSYKTNTAFQSAGAVLCSGRDTKSSSKTNTAIQSTNTVISNTAVQSILTNTRIGVKASDSSTVLQGTLSADTVIYSVRGSTESDLAKSIDLFDNELYNSFEDESFADESLLCQPDVLSKIDEVEIMMTQQPKCTPEEIKKKKDEAMKKRLRKS